jgi:ATP-binding cassette, subfamily B, bacterial
VSIPVRQYWELLATYLRPQRVRVGLLGALLLGTIGLSLLSPQIVRTFLDTAAAGGSLDVLLRAALLFVVVAVLQQIAAVATTYVGENVGWTATNALRTELVAHCLRLDLSFHKARTPGELIERIDGDVTALSRFFAQFVVRLLGNGLLMLGVLALLWREDWRVGLAMTLFALAALLTLGRIQAAAVPHWMRVRQLSAEFFGFIGELLGGTEDLRANGATGYVTGRFHATLRRWMPLNLTAGLYGYSMWIVTIGLFTLGNAIAFALGAWLFFGGQITIGTVYLIFSYTELLRRPVEEIRSELEDLQRAGASIVRVRELLDARSRLPDGPGARLPAGALGVEFERVSFAYADERPQADPSGVEGSDGAPSSAFPGASTSVIDDVTFTLAPGEVLGLLGRTGSGKTTIARLLLRIVDPDHGAVRIGGVDTRLPELAELRHRVTIVTQDVQLFQASVRDNLTFFDGAIDDERIIAALEELGLGPWLRSLPHGLDTELESGGGLSAGEAQLLALARVFLRDPGLVILDEASSRLDPATERLIERAIDRLLAGRTAVIIAHRLGTIERADRVIMLAEGRVVEQGERAALAADPESRLSAALRAGLEAVLA